MILSIVTTLYRSEPYVAEFVARASAGARALVGESYEIVIVNDGSPDRALEVARDLAARDPHLVVVDLSRNFGHHKAMMTGLATAHGAFVFLLDSDLEEEPEYLLRFASAMQDARCDVVYGVQERRKGSAFERLSGEAFYWLFAKLTDTPLPRNLVTMRLMTRRYVDALLEYGERDFVIAGLWAITGFEQQPLVVRKLDHSATTYSLRHKLAALVSSVTALSNRPLVAVFYTGALVFLLSLTYVLWLVARWVFLAQPPGGWTSLIVSVWLLGGLTLCAIGLVGIYLAKVFIEVKHRPRAVIRHVYGAPWAAEPRFDDLTPMITEKGAE
jgi:putative glycosyltransferase